MHLKEQDVQVEIDKGESILQHTKLVLKKDHTAEADSNCRKKSAQRVSTLLLCCEGVSVPGHALLLRLFSNQAQKPPAYVVFSPLCICIFSLFNETLMVNEDFGKRAGSVPAGEAASAVMGVAETVVVL